MTLAPRIFLDSGPFLAFIRRNDPDHVAAVRLFERIARGEWRSVHTSDYVITDVLNFIRKKVKQQQAAEAFLALVFGTKERPPLVHDTLRIHGGRFARALHRFQNEFDRGLSLTDWSTVVAMDDGGIQDLATFDNGFHGIVNVVEP